MKFFPNHPNRTIAQKSNVHHVDDIWSVDIVFSIDYCPEKNRTYRYVLVLLDIFSKVGWKIPLKNKNA